MEEAGEPVVSVPAAVSVVSAVVSVAVVSVVELSVEDGSVDWEASVDPVVPSVLSVESVEEEEGMGEGTSSEASLDIYNASS